MDFGVMLANFGVSVACLAVMGFAIYKAAIWLGNRIIVPLVERHIKFMDEVATGMANQSQSLQNIVEEQRAVVRELRRLKDIDGGDDRGPSDPKVRIT